MTPHWPGQRNAALARSLHGSNLPSIVGCPHRTRQTSRLNGAARRECIRHRRRLSGCGTNRHRGGSCGGWGCCCCGCGAAIVRATAAFALQLTPSCSQHRQRAATTHATKTQTRQTPLTGCLWTLAVAAVALLHGTPAPASRLRLHCRIGVGTIRTGATYATYGTADATTRIRVLRGAHDERICARLRKVPAQATERVVGEFQV